jgi:hypothetical protein
LPDQVVAPLLRALMCIPRRPDTRLILRKVDEARPPVPRYVKGADFKVVWCDSTIGRIWRHDYSGDTGGDYARFLWHWRLNGAGERPEIVGHAPTLESAMADFRRAWDAPVCIEADGPR